MKSIIILLILVIFIFNCSNNKGIEDKLESKKIEKNEKPVEKVFAVEDYLKCDYQNGNGTIIETRNDENFLWIFRKHNQVIEISDETYEEDLVIYDKPVLNEGQNSGIVIGKLNFHDVINIMQEVEAINSNQYFYWIEFTKKSDSGTNINGWLFLGVYQYDYAQFKIPYFNNRWEILETINNGKNHWTIRKMIYQDVAIWDTVNIYDKPGLVDTKIISKIIPQESEKPYINLNVTEATEEEETIDGVADRWLKIKFNEAEGWIFGGYVSIERGGYKYNTPENIIKFVLERY